VKRPASSVFLPAIASALLVSSLTISALQPGQATRQATQQESRQEVENVTAFARLYGVVRYFYPSDAAAELEWNRFAVLGVRKVRAARDAQQLAATLKELVDPLGPGVEIGADLPKDARTIAPGESLTTWRYHGPPVAPSGARSRAYRAERIKVDGAAGRAGESAAAPAGVSAEFVLASGLKARVPIALTAAEAGPDGGRMMRLNALRAALSEIQDPGDSADLDVRLADVVVVWNVFRHFYPYWQEAGVDWDARLAPQLTATRDAANAADHRDRVMQVVADARDGHGRVSDPKAAARGWLPVQFTKVANDIVISASTDPALRVGTIVSTIDDTPAAKRLAEQMTLASGTSQWKEFRGLQELLRCTPTVDVRLVIDIGNGPRATNVKCDATRPAVENRPEIVTQLAPGVWYVDLTRARMADVRPSLATLAEARGVIFDLRGYPTDAGAQILPHLIDAPEEDRWMHVARITGPFGQIDGWESHGWNMKPATPRLAGKIVFLTDGRAISYAESVMGYVADRKLATIVGSPTAGTNGNVAAFIVPSGATVGFTGMRVSGHDGRAPFHLIGVLPNVPAASTLAGLREGRDEVLERALAIVNGK
jgi:hypothetical protein